MPETRTSNAPVGKGNYLVKDGDCVESIAYEHGLFWEKVWNDPANAEIKESRANPNDLLPGDRLTLPELELRREPGGTEACHRFKRKGVPSKLVLRFLDELGEPRAGTPYRLDVEGQEFTGELDGDGVLEITIRPDARTGSIVLGEPGAEDTYELELGGLDPAREISGIQARLANLGYRCGPIDGKVGPETTAALRQFQRDHELEVTGDADAATCSKLAELHDGT